MVKRFYNAHYLVDIYDREGRLIHQVPVPKREHASFIRRIVKRRFLGTAVVRRLAEASIFERAHAVRCRFLSRRGSLQCSCLLPTWGYADYLAIQWGLLGGQVEQYSSEEGRRRRRLYEVKDEDVLF
jgi:hypothetical protein